MYLIKLARSRSHKGMFYHEYLTFLQYMATFWWNEARHDVDQNGHELDTHTKFGRCCREVPKEKY
jgi:hypothetical protein